MHKTLVENLPEMNLKDMQEQDNSNDEEEDDEEVYPLDFRTA